MKMTKTELLEMLMYMPEKYKTQNMRDLEKEVSSRLKEDNYIEVRFRRDPPILERRKHVCGRHGGY